MKEVFLGGVSEKGEQECKLACKKILELFAQKNTSAILLDDEFQKEFQILKRVLEKYLLGDYDEDGIGYLVINDDSHFFSLRCLYDYALVEAEYGRFGRCDSCVNMDFVSYNDMCVIIPKESDEICLVKVVFDESGGEDSSMKPLDCCYKTKVGIFRSDNGEIVSSVYLLEGKKDFENANIRLESEEMQARLNILVKEVKLY